jgi:hypothetical protein
MKRLLTGVLVGFLVYGFILNWSMVIAADVYVESSGACGGKTPCYSTIQQAINAANSGDTIKLAQGIYAETFILNSGKQLILPGGWDAGFTTQTPRTTAIRAPIVTNGAIAFQELRIMEIAGPMGNASIADVLEGKTFSCDTGTGLTGIMPNRGGLIYTPTATDQPIAVGYYNGSGKVVGDAGLVSGNIRSGVSIFGVAGDTNMVNTSTGDAAVGDILSGKKAWVDGSEVTGSLICPPAPTGDAVAGDVLSGKTFSNSSGTGQTGTMTNNGAGDTITPGTSDQAVAAGYWSSANTVSGDTDLVPGNIPIGVTLFGVTGKCSRLPSTGQTPSYATGDDGYYQLGCLPSVGPGTDFNRTHLPWSSSSGTGFTDNGDGTVTDNLTGLIWLKNANCLGARTWAQAISDCNGLASASCGLNDGSSAGDWRLPNINELRSLNDPGSAFPALPFGHPFTNVQSSYYWSSSTYAGGVPGAWGVHMGDGLVGFSSKADPGDYVWPVRSGN